MKKIYKNTILKHNSLLFVSIIFILSSCISPKETNLLQQKDPIYPTKGIEEYKLQVNDELECIIFTSNKELTSSFNGILTSTDAIGGGYGGRYYVLHENGKIYIPYVGEIYTLNMTLNEAEDVIQRKLRLSFSDAQVKLRLRNNIFYVVSNGNNGTYNILKDNMTIYQAIAISGYPNIDIDLAKVKIVRHDNGKDIVKTFNLKTESVVESEFYYVKPNDVIYYSTSKSSFFRATSFGTFISNIVAPITFLTTLIVLKNRIK